MRTVPRLLPASAPPCSSCLSSTSPWSLIFHNCSALIPSAGGTFLPYFLFQIPKGKRESIRPALLFELEPWLPGPGVLGLSSDGTTGAPPEVPPSEPGAVGRAWGVSFPAPPGQSRVLFAPTAEFLTVMPAGPGPPLSPELPLLTAPVPAEEGALETQRRQGRPVGRGAELAGCREASEPRSPAAERDSTASPEGSATSPEGSAAQS